ncbi:MAG TPA: lysophospholipid acyltransferase family protein [Salinimicrobium sp.]|nr:lysophospholipid acyltransferase family protein [Salinimicrobium sp.]
MAIPIIVFFPLLLLFTSSHKFYRQFFFIARIWAGFILFGMGFFPKIEREQKLKKGNSYMLIANHTSMTDIMLMLYTIKEPFVFVGKQELAKIPLFGFFYKRSCILVNRDNQKSKQEVFRQAQKRLQGGVSICIFPEGGVSDDTAIILDSFKDGAFRLAIQHQIPVVPITCYDNRKRFPFNFFEGNPGSMRVKIHSFLPTKGMASSDRKTLRESSRNIILTELQNDISPELELKGKS